MKPCPPHPGLGGLGLDFSSFLPSGLRQAPLSTTVYMLEKSSLREPPWLLAQRQPDSSVRSSEGRTEVLGLGWGGGRVKGPELHSSAYGFHPVKLSQRTATTPFCRRRPRCRVLPAWWRRHPGQAPQTTGQKWLLPSRERGWRSSTGHTLHGCDGGARTPVRGPWSGTGGPCLTHQPPPARGRGRGGHHITANASSASVTVTARRFKDANTLGKTCHVLLPPVIL